jgi:hypothetical protein
MRVDLVKNLLSVFDNRTVMLNIAADVRDVPQYVISMLCPILLPFFRFEEMERNVPKSFDRDRIVV